MLTRITGGLAAGFIATSLILAIMAGGGRAKQGSIVDRPSPVEQPAKPAGPAVPLAK
jgi:preprotein translocase subunit SecG